MLIEKQNITRPHLHLHLQRYTRDFFFYIEELQAKWIGVPAADEAKHGTSLAVDIVRTLLGPGDKGYREGEEEKKGQDPLWRRLKWGVAIAARALDVWSAPPDLSDKNMVSGQRACTDVIDWLPFRRTSKQGYTV